MSAKPDYHVSEISRKDFFLSYVLVFLLGFGIPFGLRCLYPLLPGSYYPYMLSVTSCFFCGAAAVSMGYYLKHTKTFSLESLSLYYILCAAYGCCSYGVLQENTADVLAVFALFPYVFLLFEKMIRGEKYLAFVIGNALLLLISPTAVIPVTLLLFLLSLLDSGLAHRLSPGQFVHLFLCFLLSFMLAGCRIFFEMGGNFSNHSSYSYPGFGTSYDIFSLLSRFFSGVPAAKSFLGSSDGFDVCVGLFCLLGGILFFTSQKISCRKRICYGIFTLLLVLVLETTPFQYLFSLFYHQTLTTQSCSFFLCFWIIRLCAESLSQRETRLWRICLAGLLSLAWCGAVWYQKTDLFPAFLLPVHLLLLTIYTLLLLCRARGFLRPLYPLLLPVLAVAEIGGFLFLSSNAQSAKLFPTATTNTADVSSVSDDTETDEEETDDYDKFLQKYADQDLEEVISSLQQMTTLSQEDMETYCSTALPDVFEKINGICHKLGISGDLFTPLSFTLTFDKDDNYTVIDQGNHIYNIDTTGQKKTEGNTDIAFRVSLKKKSSSPVYQYDNAAGGLIRLQKDLLTGNAADYIQVPNGDTYTYNVKIEIVSLDKSVLKQVKALIKEKEETTETEDPSSSLLLYDGIGVGVSYVAVMILLLLLRYNNREALYQKMYTWKKALSSLGIFRKISRHLSQNRVYYLAFLLPVFFYVIAMIVMDCPPFGTNSLLYSDGVNSSFPAYMDHYYKYQEGNQFLSMNGGYGMDLSLSANVSLMAKLYHYLPASAVATMIVWMVVLCTGICGCTMVYYMTHRQNHPAAKQDLRLLFPSLIYSANAYMFTFRCFSTWFFVFLLLPVLLVACDRLICQKKPFWYIAILGLCILTEIQVTLFVCIFLVIRFFTYRFDGIKDFFGKGIRFALASLFAGGCGFFTPFRTLLGYQNTVYDANDSSLPTWGFHGSFLEEWKKLMIYSPTQAVQHDDGAVTLYCGILTLLLVLVYLTSKKVSLRQKLCRLIPLLILLVSFNEKVLSYLWNGLHYQSNVPNRYVFLLLFLLAETAYDGMKLLSNTSRFRFTVLSAGLILFLGVCQYGSSGNTQTAFLVSVVLCALYLFAYSYYRYHRYFSHLLPLLLLCFVLELGTNAYYNLQSSPSSSLTTNYGNYTEMAQFFEQYLTEDSGFSRAAYFGEDSNKNSGQVYHTGEIGTFNSYLSETQVQMQKQYGFTYGTNYLETNYLSTPIGVSFSGTRYLLCPLFSNHALEELKDYTYVGYYNKYYIYENNEALSLGIYVPEDALNLPESVAEKTNSSTTVSTEEEETVSEQSNTFHITWDTYQNSLFYNDMASLYSVSNPDIFQIQSLSYNEDTSVADTYCFLDENGKTLRYEDVYDCANDEEMMGKITLSVTLTPCKEGYAYFNLSELLPLGEVTREDIEQKDTKLLHYTLPGKNFSLTTFSDVCTVITLNKDAAYQFLDVLQEQQLEDVTIQNDTITGTTNYTEDGYTMLSLAYSKNWHAYIDGEEAEIEAPYNGCMYVKTPKGTHTLELKFVPYGLQTGEIITAVFWVLLLGAGAFCRWRKHLQNRCFSVK